MTTLPRSPSTEELATALDAQAALALVAGGLEPEALGPHAGRPVLVVRVSHDDRHHLDRLWAVARHRPCVVIGVSDDDRPPTSVPELDLMLSAADAPPAPWVGPGDGFDADPRRAVDLAVAAPGAAIALVQLLRLQESLDVADGLVAESSTYGLLQSGPEFAAWLARRGAWTRPTEPEAPVLVTREGARLTITLHRPRLHNAYNAAMRDALVEAVGLALADPSITDVDLRGAGPSFSIGGDLREFGSTTDPVAAHLVRTSRHAGAAIHACAARLTAFLHGHCVGAGIELAAFAGRVVAAPGTTIKLPELELGLVPGAGGTVSIARRIGRARTGALALTGLGIDQDTARRWGLVDEVTTTAPS